MIERVAARVLLLDGSGRVLLLHGRDPGDPAAGSWWFTPGGGVEPGEDVEAAARREVLEETGLVLPADLGPRVLRRVARFRFEHAEYEQTEHYFRVRVADPRVHYGGWTETERRSMTTHRWWSAAELDATTETVYPPGLADLVRRPPEPPF